MSTQRTISFETVSDEGAERVSEALAAAFAALTREEPAGIGLGYWRRPGGRRFWALIDLVDEGANPLTDLAATRVLPGIIGSCVDGGYPRPELVEQVGRYGFGV